MMHTMAWTTLDLRQMFYETKLLNLKLWAQIVYPMQRDRKLHSIL